MSFRVCTNEVDVLESTLKRHGYYCRSRRIGSTIRSRSCISCAKGKARCDNRRRKCSRCITKGITCYYPANTSKGTDTRTEHRDDARAGQRKSATSLESGPANLGYIQEAGDDGDVIFDSGPLVADPDFANLDWFDPDLNFAELLDPQMNNKTIQYPLLESSSIVRHSTPTTQTIQVQQPMSSPNISIPRSPTYAYRALVQRPEREAGTQRIANLILHTLKSYPLMMLRHNNLPPFIHPHLISSNVANDYMEPLTNCMSLVRMISSGVHGSRKLFWRNVRLECERLNAEVCRVRDDNGRRLMRD